MRVCFISHSAERYGAELALLELIKGLIKLGFICMVLVPKKGPLLAELDSLNVEWRIIPYPVWMSRPKWLPYRIGRTLKTLLTAIYIAGVIKRWGCDIVYTNTVVVGVGAFAARLARRPHVWHSHESAYHNPDQKFDLGKRCVTYLMDHFSQMIIVTSKSVEEDYKRYLGMEKLRVIYQSVTLPEEIAHTSSLVDATLFFQCIMIGSLHPWKGQDEAIFALAELVHRGVNAHLLIVGDGGKRFRVKLLQQIVDHGLQQHVKFHGYAENPASLIRAADVVLVCSRWEAFGRVAVEAMLTGKALIGSARGATSELIQDGETGLMYEWGNHTKLADKIQYLHDNPGERARLGNNARKWAESRFTQERYAEEVGNLLFEVVAKANLSKV
ncbi:glycosyltransferase family 1 protein [Nitrosospira lacus]|uniref:Glycosyl transferase family 1 n=1 Tax=Nitrosospira lacus TaxID=1288494 RepID=A0A1W6SQ63_9PROT|nr:glycosyltransferase family 4 protein [Nitrosospira lacus]ARO87936.1 glycosyltransferase family 1 protein [Nitrosospira lacus]